MSTSTHPVAPEEVMGLLDGELSPERAAAFSKHLETCPECSAIAASQRELSQHMTAWQVGSPSARLTELVAAATQVDSAKSQSTSSWFARRRRSPAFKWAMGIASGFAGLVLLMAISTPKLLRTRMAANEATKLSRARGDVAVDTASVEGKAAGESQYYVRRLPFPDSTPPPPAGPQHAENQLSAPMIARMASLSIIAKDFDAGRASLDAILARHNGYAAGLNVSTPQGAGRALQASLRIPAPQLAPAISELKALGRVENETQSGEEVTQQHADLVARLKNSRETEQRLQDVLRTRTGKVKDVLEVEQEIARVRGEIEQMEAEQKTLEHRVDFATVDLKLAEEYKAQLSSPAPSVGMQIRNATVNGFRNAFESLLGIVLFFAEAGPTLILWLTILAIPAWLLWRRYRRAHALGSLVGA